MAKFYVFQGRRALWNLLLLVFLVLALFFIFQKDQSVENIEDNSLKNSTQLVMTEAVTVRTVPTKFSEYRLEREKARSREIEFLQNFVTDPTLSTERREEFQKKLGEIVEKMSKETELENLLKAKGYLDGFVMLEEGTITVVVPVAITRDQASVIGELVQRMTGVDLEKITIVDELIAI